MGRLLVKENLSFCLAVPAGSFSASSAYRLANPVSVLPMPLAVQGFPACRVECFSWT